MTMTERELENAAEAYKQAREKPLAEIYRLVEENGIEACLDGDVLLLSLSQDDEPYPDSWQPMPRMPECFGAPVGQVGAGEYHDRIAEIYAALDEPARKEVRAAAPADIFPLTGSGEGHDRLAVALQDCGHLMHARQWMPGHTGWELNAVLYTREAMANLKLKEGETPADRLELALAIQKARHFGDVLQCTLSFPDDTVYEGTGAYLFATRQYLIDRLGENDIPARHAEMAISAFEKREKRVPAT